MSNVFATAWDLPTTFDGRWTAKRKAAVVAAVNNGIIALTEVLERYGLAIEEFVSWKRSFERHGQNGLRATRIQDYRVSA